MTADRPATEPHPWENHDDSCQCHITICADCGCTNEIVPAEAAQGAAPLTIEEYNVPSMPSEYSEGAAPRAEGPRRITGDGGPETDDWTCSCGLTRPVTGSYGCADCGDGRPDSWERVSVEGAAPRAEGPPDPKRPMPTIGSVDAGRTREQELAQGFREAVAWARENGTKAT